MQTLSDGPLVTDDCYAMLKANSPGVLARAITLPNSRCGNCGGTGQLFFNLIEAGPFTYAPGGKKPVIYADGKFWIASLQGWPCPICNERDHVAHLAALLDNSGLNEAEREYRLDYYADMDDKQYSVSMMREALTTFPRPAGFYFLYGNYGVGKTGQMMCVISAAGRAGVSAHYTTAGNILNEIRSSYGDDRDETERAIVSRYAAYPVLAIDELGPDRVSSTQWALATLFAVLDMRYRERANLMTLTASNYAPEYLAQHEQWKYFESRTRDGLRAPVGGQSLRGRK